MNVMSDPSANITADHFPFTVTARFKLKRPTKGRDGNSVTQYKPMTEEEKENV